MSDNMEIRFGETVRLDLGNTIPVPVRDYLLMVNKPQINGHELTGNLIIRVGDLENDVGYLTVETDPTVPAWAKQPNKPTYTAEEVGAMPNTTVIPIRISQLINDTGYYIKPAGGIPLSDLVPGIIPDFSSKLDASLKGARGGVAELDQNGMVPSHQLPSYVDDVKAYSSIAMFPVIGEDDKIYVDKSTNKQYRWSGDTEVGYIPIASSIALGETAQTAYRGDRGKIAYDHAIAKGQAFVSGLYKVTVNAEGHITEAVPVVKEDITDLGIPGTMPDVSGFYTKPVNGIPASDLADGVIPDVSGFYTKPVNGIPASDLAAGVIPDVSGFYTKPVTGIPASDLASGVIPDVSGFYTKPASGIPASDLAAGVIPTVPVTDVQINGSSILDNGVANIPMASASGLGVVKPGSRLAINDSGEMYVVTASLNNIKLKSNNHIATPLNQHASVFYGLATLSGADMTNSSNPVGTYTEVALGAIQKLFGLDGILGNYELSIIASKAYAIGETFVYNGKRYRVTAAITQGGIITPGTNCELCPIDGHYVRDTDYASTDAAGLAKASSTYGTSALSSSGTIIIFQASASDIKAGTHNYRPIVPSNQHQSVFYALAKAAGDTTQAQSSNPVGTYTAEAKAAILTMLGMAFSTANSAQEIIAAYTNPAIRTDASGVSF